MIVEYKRVNIDNIYDEMRKGFYRTKDLYVFQSSPGSAAFTWMVRDVRELMFHCDSCGSWWFTESPDTAQCTCGDKDTLRAVRFRGKFRSMMFKCSNEKCGKILDEQDPMLLLVNNDESICMHCKAPVDLLEEPPVCFMARDLEGGER